MSGDIYVGFDKDCPPGQSAYNDGYVNSAIFESFRMTLENALQDDFGQELETILEGQYMGIISFVDLNASSFNGVIGKLHLYFSDEANKPLFFMNAKWAWDNVVETFVRKDARYDASLHGDGEI